MMEKTPVSSYQNGQMVVVQIENRKGESEWFVGMIVREARGGYLVRVASLLEYRRPLYEEPKRRWRTMTRDDKYSEREHHLLWSGWVEVPDDPMFVLFSRVASASFLRDLKVRLAGSDVSSVTMRECIVPFSAVFPAQAEKLRQALLT